jgi:hypothetical protein
MTSKTATLGITAAVCFSIVFASILATTLWDYPESMWILLVPIGMFVSGALGVAALAGMFSNAVTDR